MPIFRLFDSHEDAMAAAAELRAVGDTRYGVQINAAAAEDFSLDTMRDVGLPDDQAQRFAERVKAGGALMMVEAPFGTAARATAILKRPRPNDAAVPETIETRPPRVARPGDGRPGVTPLSIAIDLPVLLSDPTPLSTYLKLPTLLRRPGRKSSSLGAPLLSKKAAPFSSWIRMPLLSRDAAPLSARLGVKVLAPDAAPLSSKLGVKVLLADAAPLSSRLGVRVLSPSAAPLSSKVGLPSISRNPAPLSSLLGLPVLLREKTDRS